MAKRKTAKQREDEARERLYDRVYDVVCGACGREFEDNGDEYLTAEELSRVVPALHDLFKGGPFGTVDASPERYENDYLFNTHNLHHYERPATIAAFLFDHSVRA